MLSSPAATAGEPFEINAVHLRRSNEAPHTEQGDCIHSVRTLARNQSRIVHHTANKTRHHYIGSANPHSSRNL
ncbi:hypothetical protein MUK42_35913 [Musa troglodytarum]|uniref:Uncharacterized protein n=1 Tax=Musa troglodytarum TaxID=320322 RepID=A0A9E7HFF0_9LILI|nr:hypothetical protein MUK42_35913 [Musa troglodytarum]